MTEEPLAVGTSPTTSNTLLEDDVFAVNEGGSIWGFVPLKIEFAMKFGDRDIRSV